MHIYTNSVPFVALHNDRSPSSHSIHTLRSPSSHSVHGLHTSISQHGLHGGYHGGYQEISYSEDLPPPYKAMYVEHHPLNSTTQWSTSIDDNTAFPPREIVEKEKRDHRLKYLLIFTNCFMLLPALINLFDCPVESAPLFVLFACLCHILNIMLIFYTRNRRFEGRLNQGLDLAVNIFVNGIIAAWLLAATIYIFVSAPTVGKIGNCRRMVHYYDAVTVILLFYIYFIIAIGFIGYYVRMYWKLRH